MNEEMAQSEKVFKDLLCEGRAQPAESSDPTTARTIDELRKQVSRLRSELESEKLLAKQQEWQHEKDLRKLREEMDKKVDATVEVLMLRKDQEKHTELKRQEERLRRQMEQELKQHERDMMEELRRAQRRLERERNDSIRHAVEDERRTALEEMQRMLPEDECALREAKLAREVFLLGEQNEQLQETVRNLTAENRSQIDLVRRLKHEHEAEIASLIKQSQSEASRDMAQLRLAERVIAEREADLQVVGYRADVVMMEKEALAEELVAVKSTKVISTSSVLESASSPSLGRRSISGPGGVLQKRVEDLEAIARKLEDERQELKQENASLRKKLVQEGEGAFGKQVGGEEKLKKLRKRNADLVALAKQLDEKCKALKLENEQLQKQAGSGGDTEQQVRKSISRQHARDIMDYTKQIHSKDRELEVLRRKLTKYEISGPAPKPAPAPPELERQMKAMAMERLRMEKLLAKLYSKIPDDADVDNISRKEIQSKAERVEKLAEENEALRRQLAATKQDEVDYPPASGTTEPVAKATGLGSPSLPRQGSVEQALGRVEVLKQENQELVAQRDALAARVEELWKFESECASLQASAEGLEAARLSAEHQLRSVSQQLETAKVAVAEMEQVQDHCGELEREVAEVRGQLNEKDTEICQLELDCQKARATLATREEEADALRRSVIDLEGIISEKEKECSEVRLSFQNLQLQSRPPVTSDVGQQAAPTQTDAGQQISPAQADAGQQTASPSQADAGQQTSPQSSSRRQFNPQHLLADNGSQSSAQSSGHQPDSEQGVKPDSTVSMTTATTATTVTTTSTTPTKKFSRERVKSPVHRDITRLRVSSPKASTGDLSLEFEMKAAGFEVTDSYDSSECVGFMSDDANLDDTLHGDSSTLSLETAGSERHDEQSPVKVGGRERRKESEGQRETSSDKTAGKPRADEGRGKEEGEAKEPLVAAEREGVRDSLEEKEAGRRGEEWAPVVQSGVETIAVEGRPLAGRGEGGGGEGGRGSEGGAVEVEGGGKRMSLEELAMEESSDSDLASTDSSEGDLPALKKGAAPKTAEEAGTGVAMPSGQEEERQQLEGGSDGGSMVSVFIAKFTYVPAEMSPNPNFEQELAIQAGDYLYVFGDMDEDGFYHGELMNGECGLVPSNFIERVLDDSECSAHPYKKGLLGRRRLSNLQAIAEEDEEVSSGGSIPPPRKVELERQFVEGTGYSVVIQWEPPHPLPPEATGYSVYVNGEFRVNVEGADRRNVLLSGIPRQQLVKISVRTVTEEGESPDPKLIILNPHYPESPTDVKIKNPSPPRVLVVEWAPSPPVNGGLPVSGYAIYINNHRVVQLAANEAPMENVCAQLVGDDLRHLKHIRQDVVSLTVRAIADRYESLNSNAVVVSKELLSSLLDGSSSQGSRTSSTVSASGDERGTYSPAKRDREGHVTTDKNHVTTDVGHVTSDGVDGTDGGHVNGRVVNGSADGLYYRALYSYDPFYNSPNDGGADEELIFQEGAIIAGKGTIDEDGFFEGELNGRIGLVPSNMVEVISDKEELAKIHDVLRVQREKAVSPTINGQTSPLLEDVVARRMRAAYDYVPSTDSPNDTVEEELPFREGDVLLVYGRMDDDGFYQAELKGKKGLVPSTFLEELVSPEQTPERELPTGSDPQAADSAHRDRSSSTKRQSPKPKNLVSQDRDSLTQSLPAHRRRGSK